MDEALESHVWVDIEATTLLVSDGEPSWYTFGGGRLNAALASQLSRAAAEVRHDSFGVHFTDVSDRGRLYDRIVQVIDSDPSSIVPPIDEETFEELKFAECVPPKLLSVMGRERFSCKPARHVIRKQALVVIADSG